MDSDVDEELYVQLAGLKSEEEVDDEVMCRPALVPRGGRGGRRWWLGYGEVFCIGGLTLDSGRSSLHPSKMTPPVSDVLQMTWVAGLSQRRGSELD